MRKQSEYIAEWEPCQIQCPFCKYPLASKMDVCCNGCGHDLKHYYTFKQQIETLEEIRQREDDVKNKERIWMEKVILLPDKPKRGTALWGVTLMLGLGFIFFLLKESFYGWFMTISGIFGIFTIEWLYQSQLKKFDLSKNSPDDYYQLIVKERMELRKYNARKEIRNNNYLQIKGDDKMLVLFRKQKPYCVKWSKKTGTEKKLWFRSKKECFEYAKVNVSKGRSILMFKKKWNGILKEIPLKKVMK